jgi:DNA-binding NarL/FixJ family response regulator
MSQSGARHPVAIIDAKELRRAGITSLFEPWARAEKLRLTSFTPDQAHEVLQADTVRMLIFSIGGESIAERQNMQQLKVLRALAPKVPLVIISDRDDANDITAAFTAEAQGYINSGMPSALAFQTLSFILNGGSYFPPSAMYKLPARSEQAEPPVGPTEDSKSEPKNNGQEANGGASAHSRSNLESRTVNLTVRQQEVLDHLRLGESNKLIARRLSMTEGTVKVHLRQMMRKCQVSNRTQLALDGSTVAKISEGDSHISPEQDLGSTAKPVSSTHQSSLIGTASRGRPRAFGNH